MKMPKIRERLKTLNSGLSVIEQISTRIQFSLYGKHLWVLSTTSIPKGIPHKVKLSIDLFYNLLLNLKSLYLSSGKSRSGTLLERVNYLFGRKNLLESIGHIASGDLIKVVECFGHVLDALELKSGVRVDKKDLDSFWPIYSDVKRYVDGTYLSNFPKRIGRDYRKLDLELGTILGYEKNALGLFLEGKLNDALEECGAWQSFASSTTLIRIMEQ